MTYTELQEKAKSLGLPSEGLSKKELEQSIQEAENKNASNSETSENTPSTEPEIEPEEEPKTTTEEVKDNKKPQEKKEAPQKKFNAAIVKDGSREIRRYTIEDHGKNFAELAKQYADHKGYRVEHAMVEPDIVCPSCHYRFSL